MQVIGKLEEVHDTVKRTETFSVREFVLEISSPTSQYSEHVLFQLTNGRTTLVDSFQVGQEIVVDFDLQGRKWTNPEGRVVFFNRLNAWRISPYAPQMAAAQPMGGFQQPAPAPAYGQQQFGGYQQQPAPAPATQAFQQPAQNAASQANADNGDDLPF